MPAFRGKRFQPLQVKREINRMMDLFPKQQVRVKRLLDHYTDTGVQTTAATLVYEGEALVRPASGDTEGYGLGTVENQSLVIVINGIFDMKQGDIVTVNDGREYEVDFPPHHMNAFTVLNLQQRSQIRQPVQ
ncbi:MAG TPA: hypothetical protein VFP01_11305 [Propionibacteriaceae bacterium]|nr:hypothetical protein [Propionibacteriaceae bacterium]